MKVKVVIVALLLPIALLGIITWFSGGFRSTTPSTVTEVSPAKSMPALSVISEANATNLNPPKQQSLVANPRAAKDKATEEEIHEQAVRRRIAELNDLAMNNDTNSLNTILSELNNSDKEIRKGALEAVIQFADRAAISRLQGIADRTGDATEKVALLEAIEYLKLPSLTEYLREKGKTR